MGLQTEENKELSEKLGKIVSKNPSKWIEESNERSRIKQIEKDKEMIDFGLWLTKKEIIILIIGIKQCPKC